MLEMLERRRSPKLAGGLRSFALWRLKYPVWAMRDGYIPVYTVGMVNTRYIPVFLEYSDPSTVSRLRVEPPRAAPVPPRHALGDAARMLRWAYYSLLARARGAARLRLAAAEPGSRGVPVYGSPKTKIPGMGKRARVYTGIYRYFTIPVYTLRNTPATIGQGRPVAIRDKNKRVNWDEWLAASLA